VSASRLIGATELSRRDRERFYAIETIGCQMNVYDSERMAESLGRHGYRATTDYSLADLILINTCSVRDKSEHKMESAVGKLKVLREHNSDLVIGVAGCVAQQEGATLLRRFPQLDLVLGPDQLTRLPALVTDIRDTRTRRLEIELTHRKQYRFVQPEPPTDGRVTSFVTVMKGCNKFCAFCIVPTTRGREVSKPSAEVVAEVRLLVEHGVREVTLLGQNVNSYGKDWRGAEPDFAGLLRQVHDIDGLARIRFTTSHPMDCSPHLIEAFGDLPRLAPWMHLPVQAGSERIVRMMRRSHSVEQLRDQVASLRRARPEIAMSTDIIVGFPGETEDDFQCTLNLLAELRFATIFSFIYSERPGTAAARIEDDVPLAVKKERLQRVQKLQNDLTARWMASHANQEVDVLFEGPSARRPPALGATMSSLGGPPQVMGRTGQNVKVHVAASDASAMLTWPGRVGRVQVERVGRHSLSGRLLNLN